MNMNQIWRHQNPKIVSMPTLSLRFVAIRGVAKTDGPKNGYDNNPGANDNKVVGVKLIGI